MEIVKTKLRLHLWTEEEYKEKALRVCVNNTFKEIDKYFPIAGDLERRILEETKNKAIKAVSNIDIESFAIRTPSLSYSEIPKLIEQITSEENKAVYNYICLDNDIYKYISIHFKYLLFNGSIQIYIDGIHHTGILSMYNINLALMIAINATDNSLKFRNAISNPSK